MDTDEKSYSLWKCVGERRNILWNALIDYVYFIRIFLYLIRYKPAEPQTLFFNSMLLSFSLVFVS